MSAPEPIARATRNLIVLRAGDGSLHREWIAGPRRDFDLFISHYGHTPERWREDADHHEMRPGPKWPCIAELLAEHAALVAAYDCVWLPDDDLSVSTATLNRMTAAPTLTRCSWTTMPRARRNRSHVRWRCCPAPARRAWR